LMAGSLAFGSGGSSAFGATAGCGTGGRMGMPTLAFSATGGPGGRAALGGLRGTGRPWARLEARIRMRMTAA